MSPTATSLPVRIAVIEDNPDDLYILRKALEKARVRFEIDHLDNGEAAIHYLLRQGPYANALPPDLIILDLNLPRLSGIEVITRVRDDPKVKAIPLIVLSTSLAREDQRKMTELGAVRYLIKSSNLQDFLAIGEIIREFLATEERREALGASGAPIRS